MNDIFFFIMCMCITFLGKKASQQRLWEVLTNEFQGNAGSGLLDVDVTLNHYLKPAAEQVYPFMATIFPNDSGVLH